MTRLVRAARGLVVSGALLLIACSQANPDSTAPPIAVAERIVTLSPHLAELVVSAGAGDRLVGVSAHSDFPDAVRSLPVVGDAFLVDLEQLTLLDPDLILAWESGTPARTVDELRERGYRVEVLRTRQSPDIAEALRRIGRLAGTGERADDAALRFLAGLDELRRANADGEPIRVFYQISTRPLYTVNGRHYVSEVIEICGGRNVFADLDELAPLVAEESVLARNPEIVLGGGGPESGDDDAFLEWRRWPSLAAVAYGNLFTVEAGLLGRATTRLVEAAVEVCDRLDRGRANRREAA